MNSAGWRGESRDPIDPVAANREHHDAVRVVDAVALFVGVGGERGLAVGACRDEPDPVELAVEWGGGEEAADLGAALEALRLGRHREQRVVGEQRDDRRRSRPPPRPPGSGA